MKTIKINITSDIVCPWCFVGKRRLEKAIDLIKSKHDGVSFELKYFPYMLNPNYPFEGVDKEYAYAMKFGGERSKQLIANMVEVGKTEDIKFDYGGLISSTLRAHSLSEFASHHGKQIELMEELFHNYFEERKNIGDIETLVKAASKCGLDENDARNYLLDESNLLKVEKNLANNRASGINGVPYFVIQDKYAISGGQSPENFVTVFEKVLNDN